MKVGPILPSLIAISALSASSVRADYFIFKTTFAAAPTFDRPRGNDDRPPNSLYGTQVGYRAIPFFVTSGGYAVFRTVNAIPGTGAGADFDTYFHLYSNSFDPASPLTNALRSSDDVDDGGPNGHWSGIAAPLTPGMPYVLVVSGYSGDDFGTLEIVGATPGLVGFGSPAKAAPVVRTTSSVRGGKKVIIRGRISGLIGASRVDVKVPGSGFKKAGLDPDEARTQNFVFTANLERVNRGTITVRASNAIGQQTLRRIRIKPPVMGGRILNDRSVGLR